MGVKFHIVSTKVGRAHTHRRTPRLRHDFSSVVMLPQPVPGGEAMPGHDLFVRGGEHCLVDTCVGFHACYSYIGASKKV